MKRVLFTLLTVCLLLVCVCSPVFAGVIPIDPAAAASLTLQYRYDGTSYGGVAVQTYRVASVSADGSLDLVAPFDGYPVSVHGITSQGEWHRLADTLAGYVAADGVAPTASAVTNEEGSVSFAGLSTGLYLTLGVRVETEIAVTVFENFMTMLPHPQEDGSHLYDVTAYPKCSAYTPTPDEVDYSVVKHWRDGGQGRPTSVTVDVLKNGALHTTQTLSAENDWCYRWTHPDDGSVWQVVERDVPDGYTVTAEKNDTVFLLTNTRDGGETPPSTGDTFVVWPYVVGMVLSGGLLLIVATWRKRNEV